MRDYFLDGAAIHRMTTTVKVKEATNQKRGRTSQITRTTVVANLELLYKFTILACLSSVCEKQKWSKS